MGLAPSKTEDDKILGLCQERKRYVREALDGRCALASAHYDYIASLKDTGSLLRKCFAPEGPKESIPNLAPSLLHINHMRAGRNSVARIEEKLSIPVTVTIRSSSPAARQAISDLEGSASFETPPETPAWDYSDLVHSVDNQFLIQDKDKLSQDFDNADDLRLLREEEGIPALEEDENKTPENDKEGYFAKSKDGIGNNSSTETLVKVSKNCNNVSVENTLTERSPMRRALERVVSENTALLNTDSQSDKPKNARIVIDIGTNENDGIPAMTPVNVVPSSAATLPMGSKEPYPNVNIVVKDLYSCMKEIEVLFFSAFDSGKQVPRILEEDKIQFRRLLPEEIAHGSKASNFLARFLACCREEVPVPEPPPQAEIKYLTWHRSVSSQFSPSRNPTGTIAGIHTSILDRLYAWETKLYDEVKASSAICRRYNEKCKQLRDQESRGKNQINIDFTRATVKDLYSRILVAIQRIDFISENIEDLRDKELQPQLDELVGSLTSMWATMLECHRHQHVIIKLVSSSCNVKISFESESQCQAALLLSVELSKLYSNFQNWMASHKAYLCSLKLWLHKCMKPVKKRKSSRKKNVIDVSFTDCDVAPIFTTCEIWMKLLDDLPTKDLEEAIEGLIADISHLPRHSVPRLDQIPNGEMGEEILKKDASADIQSSLMTFLEKLEAISEISLQKYIDLQKNISAARERLLRGV